MTFGDRSEDRNTCSNDRCDWFSCRHNSELHLSIHPRADHQLSHWMRFTAYIRRECALILGLLTTKRNILNQYLCWIHFIPCTCTARNMYHIDWSIPLAISLSLQWLYRSSDIRPSDSMAITYVCIPSVLSNPILDDLRHSQLGHHVSFAKDEIFKQ